MPADHTCRAQYPRPHNIAPNTRVIRCDRLHGHGGDHAELYDGEPTVTWPTESPVTPTGVPMAPDGPNAAQRGAQGADGTSEAVRVPRPMAESIARLHELAAITEKPASTPDDVYEQFASALMQVDHSDDDMFEWHPCEPNCGRCACAGKPWPSKPVRDAIDAARDDCAKPFLAEVDKLSRALDRACTERDDWRARCHQAWDQLDLEQHQGGEHATGGTVPQTDGGEWTSRYGYRDDAGAFVWVPGAAPHAATVCTLKGRVMLRQRVWTGPVHAIETITEETA